MKITGLKSDRGFTLAEVVVSVAIFSITILMTTQLSSYGSAYTANDQRKSAAINIGASLMEDLRNRYSTDPWIVQGTHTQAYDINGLPVATGGVYTATWTTVFETPVAGILTLQLLVSWTGANGIASSISLQTFRVDD